MTNHTSTAAAADQLDNDTRGRGRPTTGERVEIRLPSEVRAHVEAWADAEGVTAAEAYRRLIAAGLDAEMTTPNQTYRLPYRSENGPYSAPPWLELIHAANHINAGTFGEPLRTGDWWAGGYYEEYEHARVILPGPGRAESEGVYIVPRTEHGAIVLAEAAGLDAES